MNSSEKRTTLALASIFSFRMLGLFMVLPVFSLYARHLQHATPFLIGVAIGIYGLTQALLQFPFGMLSDYYSRKSIIALGLILFIMGSIVAGCSHSIEGIILGRALQGGGAVGSVIMALLADLTRDSQRSKAMAIIGIMIGFSFLLAMLLGPLLGNWLHLNGLFWLSALLGLVGIIFLYQLVPTPQQIVSPTKLRFTEHFKTLISNIELLRLDFGIFCLHVILTASFVIIPIFISQYVNQRDTWLIYFGTLIMSCAITFPSLSFSERKKWVKAFFITAIIILIAALIWFWFLHFNLWQLAIGLLIFFSAFNFLEANLPSLISRTAPPECKGAAIGIYSSCQFLGIFCGGLLGGWLFGHTQPATLFLVCGIIAMLWLLTAFSMSDLANITTRTLHVGSVNE
jgi:MFS family permease